jgi:hypothetical protein
MTELSGRPNHLDNPNVYIRVSEISRCPNYLDVKGVASAKVYSGSRNRPTLADTSQLSIGRKSQFRQFWTAKLA